MARRRAWSSWPACPGVAGASRATPHEPTALPGFLMPDSHLDLNLASLARAGGRDVAPALAGCDADGELELESAAVVGVSLRTPRGLVRVHGRHEPVAEADRLLPAPGPDGGLLVIIGGGAGYVLDAVERRGGHGRVLLLEPSAASLKAMLSRRSWAPLVDSGRLRLLAGPDYPGWMDLAKWVGAVEGTPPLVVHPVIARERPDEVRRAADVLKRLLFNADANEAARKTFAGPYLLNTLTNLRHLVESRDVAELFGAFAGVPAFVLAAGPSLNRNLEELRPHRDRALVVAVDTALRPSLAQGVEPDLVVGVDPGEANLRHLSVGGAPLRTHLVAEPSLAPGSFDAFAGRVFTFRVARHHPWPWLQEHGIDRAQLLAWGSVLTTALDLTVRLGCNPVVLFGADFAYTDGQPYCRGTVFEDDWARQVEAGAPIEQVWRQWMRQPTVVERGIDGREVETSAHLQAFRDWVVEFCGKHPEVEFVNGTGAGSLDLPHDWPTPPSTRPASRPNRIAADSPPRAVRGAARARARDLALTGARALRGGPTESNAGASLAEAAAETAVPAAALHQALAGSMRTTMIRMLPDVPLAQHGGEFEQLLCWIDELPHVGVLVEIGSRFGGSFHALAAHIGPPLTAVAVDLPEGPWGGKGSAESLQRVAQGLKDRSIDAHVVLGSSRDPAVVDAVRRLLAGRPIDVLFVDGDHTLAGVSGDLDLYAALVRPGGLVAMHDVGWPYGCDALAHAPFAADTLRTLADVNAAFQSLARGRRHATVTHEWGMGAVWI